MPHWCRLVLLLHRGQKSLLEFEPVQLLPRLLAHRGVGGAPEGRGDGRGGESGGQRAGQNGWGQLLGGRHGRGQRLDRWYWRGHAAVHGVIIREGLELLEAVLEILHQLREFGILHFPQLTQGVARFLLKIKSGHEFEKLPGLLVLLTGRHVALHGKLVHVTESLAQRPPGEVTHEVVETLGEGRESGDVCIKVLQQLPHLVDALRLVHQQLDALLPRADLHQGPEARQPPHAVQLSLSQGLELGLGALQVSAEKRGRGSVEMLTNNELVSLEEMLHGKVVKEKILNKELEYFVRQLEGIVRVYEDILDNLIQELGGWRGAECVDGQLGGGGVREGPVHCGDSGGHSEYENKRQPRVSLDQRDEVSQG